MAKRKPRTMTDEKGNEIEVRLLKNQIVKRDKIVRATIVKAERLNKRLLEEKRKILELLDTHLDEFAETYGKKWKGNASLLSFDKELRVEIGINDSITFSEELQIAKQFLDELVKDWSEGANKNLKALVMDAFQVDKKGKLDKRRILGLRQYKIDDERWAKAMQLINDSIVVIGSKRYLTFHKRDENGKESQISLNFSSL